MNAVVFLSWFAALGLQTGTNFSEVTLLDPEGVQADWTKLTSERIVVIAYNGVACPLAGKWAGRLREIEEIYRKKGVRFVGVNANPQDSRQKIAQEARELGFEFPVFKDARQALTRVLGAETTTEVFVLNAAGVVVYRGAIDDQHSLGGSKPAPSRHYLVDALEATLQQRAPALAQTQAPGCKITLLDGDALPAHPTWSEEVAPILRANCTPCHQEKGGAPFSLEEYSAALGWSAMIDEVVQEGRMPPWNADERFAGHFANERSLDAWERAVLARWVEQGAKEGEPGVNARSERYGDGWRLGVPDAEYAMEVRLNWNGNEILEEPLAPQGFAVPRQGVIEYQYFAAQTDFASERWVRAVEIKPEARDVVHHVLVWAEDPEAPGNWLTDGAFRNYFAATVPGDFPIVYGEGLAKRLPAGARLIFQLHYTANGKERFDRTRIALYFAEEEHPREVITAAVIQPRLRIPAGAKAHRVTAREQLEEEMELLSLLPHMHVRGRDFLYKAYLPDGSEVDLFEGRFDFNWQDSYRWKVPVRLPRGTVLECVGHYDNSADNVANPDPSREVRWGDQTFEEMFIGYFDYVRAEKERGSQ